MYAAPQISEHTEASEHIPPLAREPGACGCWLPRPLGHHPRLPPNVFQQCCIPDEVLAGLRPWLSGKAELLPGSRVLEGRFTAVQQAIGVPRRQGRIDDDAAATAFLDAFVAEAKASGLLQRLLEKHHVQGKLTLA